MPANQLNIGGKVSDYFLIEAPICATISAEAFKAVDKGRNQSITIWIGRKPLDRQSPEMGAFYVRMQELSRLEPFSSTISSFGTDAEGIPFVCMENVDGQPIRSGNVDIAAAERRFFAAIRSIEKLHDAGISCGDLSASSFWYGRDGEINFIGVAGLPDNFNARNLPEDCGEFLTFLAPELRAQMSEQVSAHQALVRMPANDVFSLGVLGYYLLTGNLPWGDRYNRELADLPKEPPFLIKEALRNAPAWSEELLMKCLHPNPRHRYMNAGALFKALMSVREGGYNAATVPAVVNPRESAQRAAGKRTDLKVFPGQSVEALKAREAAKEQAKPVVQTRSSQVSAEILKHRKPIGIAAVGVTALACACLMLSGGEHESNNRLKEDLEVHRTAATNAELKKAIEGIGKEDASFSEKQNSFQSLVISGDPVAHAVLVKSAMEADSERLRMAAEAAVVERAERHGLSKSAEAVKAWLSTVTRDPLPKNYENILKCLDPSMPVKERDPALEQAFAELPSVTIRLTASLALDTRRFKDFEGLLTNMIGKGIGEDFSRGHSALALMLLHPELSILYSNDVIDNAELIPKADLEWLMEQAQDHSSDVNIPAIAGLAIKAKVYDSLHSVFLEPLRDKPRLPAAVVAALLHQAVGQARSEDMMALSNWYEPESEKILLAVCASAADRATQRQAFDMLTGRPLRIEPAASLIDWVKSHYWEKRGELVHAIGVLSNEGLIGHDDVKAAFSAFDPLVQDSTLIPVFLASNDPAILKLTLEKYGQFVGSSSVLKLLDHPDRGVRIMAVKSLARIDNLDFLSEVISKSKKEQDPAVKQAYQDVFFVIKNKEKRT